MNITNAPAGTIRSALRYPDFRWLLSALAVSQIGDWLYNLALVVLVYDRTHSALWAGVTTAARVVPVVVLGPLGGVMADRFDRLAAGGALILLAAWPRSVASCLPRDRGRRDGRRCPVYRAWPRHAAVVEDTDCRRHAAAASGAAAGPRSAAPPGSPASAFTLNALTFGLSALAVLAIRADGDPNPFRPRGSGGGGEGGGGTMCSVLYGTQTVLLLLVSRQVGLGAQGYGYMFAAIGAGGLLGTALAGRVSRLESRPVLAATLALAGLPTLLLAVVRWPAAAIVLTGLTGMGALLVEILTETTLQRELDEDVFGRAYGIAFPAAIAGIVVGSVLAPGLAALLGASGALIATGAVVLAYTPVIAGRGRRVPAALPVPQATAA